VRLASATVRGYGARVTSFATVTQWFALAANPASSLDHYFLVVQ
jgi:hypothetical protein